MAAMPVDAGHDLTNFDEVWDLMAATEVPLAWRLGLQAPFQARRVRARASGKPGARALLLYSPTDAWRQVEVARGPEAEVLALLKGLQREADGIVWDDDLPAVAHDEVAEAATDHGCGRSIQRPVRRRDHDVAGEMSMHLLGVDVLTGGDRIEHVTLGQDARLVVIGVHDHDRADLAL